MVKPEIDYDHFAKLDLRVGTIVKAERVEKSKKLLRLEVDLGFEKRQVVAGIAEAYTPEQIVGKQAPVLINLKPAKLMGVESRGMILAGDFEGKPLLLHPEKGTRNGTGIK